MVLFVVLFWGKDDVVDQPRGFVCFEPGATGAYTAVGPRCYTLLFYILKAKRKKKEKEKEKENEKQKQKAKQKKTLVC